MDAVLSRLLEKAGQLPDRTAIWTDSGSFTFSELVDYSRRVAFSLSKDGVGKGDVVVIELPRCREYWAVAFATWMVGGIFVPCDSSYPDERKDYIAGDCSAKVRVTRNYLDSVGSETIPAIYDSFAEDDVAFITYTSGSTGRPKGVVHTHASASGCMERASGIIGMQGEDRFALPASFTFIAATTFVLGTVPVGFPVFIVPDEARVNLLRLASFTAEHRITHMFMAPAMVSYFRQIRPTVRRIFVAGERASNIYSDEYEIINAYGLTETCGFATAFTIDKKYESTPLGKPLPGVCAYVLDEEGAEADEGEICLAGQFAKGYHNLPSETAEVFVPNPFKERDGFPVMFRTGDIGRRLPDGNLVFLERRDWMVNINGQRVEPAEIAAVLTSMPQVVQAVVKDFQGDDGQTFLCGYYRLVTPVSEDEIRRYLSSKLPRYMVPAYLVRMDSLPLNSSGKVDRSRLPDPRESRLDDSVGEGVPAPDNAVVAGIRTELKSASGRGDYGYDEDLVGCGLSSLSAIKFASGIMDRFGTDLEVTSLLQGCSIRSIESAIIDSLIGARSETPVSSTGLKESYPLTKSQLGVFGEIYANPSTTTYNLPFAYDVVSDDRCLEDVLAAIRIVFGAHPALGCTVAPDSDGIPCMFPHPGADVRIEVIEGTVTDYDAYRASFVRPYDVSESLYRCTVFVVPGLFRCLFDFNHMVFDGSSAIVFREDLATALSGGTVQAEKNSIFDIAEEEAGTEGSQRYEDAARYYSDLLGGTEGVTLPMRDLPEGESRKGEFVAGCSRLLRDDVRRFAESQGISEDSFFQAVIGFVLARYGSVAESCYTTVHSGRNGGRTGRTVGMLVRTLPVVCRFDSSDSPEDLSKRIHSQLVESRRNDVYPFTEIATNLGVTTDFMFAYQAILDESLQKDTIAVGDIKNRISVQLMPSGDGFSLVSEYDASMYSTEFIQSFCESVFQAALGFLSCDRLGSISISDDRQITLLDSFNDTASDYDRSATFVSLFRSQVKRDPGHEAVWYNGTSWTYGEFDEITDRVAAYVHSVGIGRNEFVAVLTGRNDVGVIANWGVVKSGAGYQPLDPSYPVDRLGFMVEDSCARMMIVERSLTESNADIARFVESFEGRILYTDEIPSLPVGEVPSGPSPEDAVIILYTSGTTGKPKGCVIEHRNMVATLQEHRVMNHLGPDARGSQYASFGFDAGFMETFFPLCCGASFYIIDDSIRTDIKAMEAFYIEHSLTYGFMTTQVGRMFVEMARVPSLKCFTTGGEKLVPVNPPEWVEFYDMYGPSEASVFVTSHRVIDDRPMQPIGRPNRNVRLYVVDKDMNRLPVGALGELCISGMQVARGYLNRPDKNEECFIENPFTDDPLYSRMYRTGDVARILPDGNLDFIGRSDGQVKIRGFRIELGEVERVVRDYPGITDATVQAFDAPGGGKFIAAYVVSTEKVDPVSLGAFIRETKPPYLVPAVIMQIDAIPLTVNSKVDRRRLPAPVVDAGEVRLPETDMQKRIHAVVSKVIGTDDFGTDTDLFSAGLTSIGSIRLNVLLSDEFGIAFESRDIRDNPTVLLLEGFINRSAPAEEYGVQDDYPLTKTQEGIFVECLARPGSTAYNVPLILRIDSSIDSARLKESIVRAVDAHPYMATSLFQNTEGEARFRRSGPGLFLVSDIEEVDAESIDSVRQDLIKPYDLFGPRLFRIFLIHADYEYILIDMHHIIGDGTSMRIFTDTVSRAYSGEDVPSEQFSGFEASLKESCERDSGRLESSRNYYSDLLSGYDRDFLPKGDVYHADPDAPIFYSTHGRKGLAADAAGFCETNKVGLNALMCSAFGYVLSGYNGSTHSVYTTIYNGRNDSRTAYSVSMYVKTLPVVCDFADRTRSPRDVAESMGKQLVDSMSNDIYSFSEISRDLDVKADVLFVYQGDEFLFESFCGMPSQMVDISLSDEKEPILFQVLKDGDTFRYMVDYDSSRFTPEFIRYLTRSVDNAVSQFISSKTIDDIDLSDEETFTLVSRVNDTDEPFDQVRTVVDDFVDAARRDPAHIAVVCEGRSITYGELDEVSDCIAGYVRSLGIGRDEFVGILVPRCIEMVTAAEGVLKSGAAYQPLDPTYPEERLAFMLEDSRVRLLIADRALLEKVPSFAGTILCLDEIPALVSQGRPDVSAFRPSQKDAVIILYTSGTTGTPKGCVLEHRNLYSYLCWMKKEVGLGPDSVYASYASYGFDACMMDIHASMTSGATMHIIPDSMRKDLHEVDGYYRLHGITHGFMTTQMGRMFMESTSARSIKAFMAGGEALVPLVPPSWVDFYNIYGPTECTVNLTTYIVRDDCPLIPIGRPNRNVRVYVLDKSDRIVPVGCCGELCASGPQVFREYLNNPDKTAMTVVRNPYADCPEHARLYRTGDVVRLLPDGNIDYIGRRDGMVKVRGFRIELGEVEKAVRDHPAVTNAAVTAIDNPAGGKSLVAYYVTDTGVSVQDLKDFIQKSKPPYMVPSYFVQMDSIPVNVNGKVDKRRLPAPAMEADREGSEPVNDTEAGLCSIFATVLGISKVFADDDFFEIGGTSISASKLVMNCMKAGYPLVFKNVFDNPTPRALSEFIMSQKGAVAVEETRQAIDNGPLGSNVVSSLDDISTRPPGRVLLTGATGFLGSHILRELLDKGAEQVVCLVRASKGQSPDQRVRTVYKYYFGGLQDESAFERVSTVDSDITDPSLASRIEGIEFDTIINCAAVVKHFAADDSIERINVGGVENLVIVAKDRGCLFVQISTESVAGESVNGSVPEGRRLKENELDIGQNLDNKYAASKYKAEELIIKAMSEGLRAKIMRVGNLMSRDSDGEFQINSATNAFMNHIRAYTKIGCFPVTGLDSPVEFSPIDKVAEAVVILSGTPDRFTVFHVDNCHKVHMANVVRALQENNLHADIVPEADFRKAFSEVLADDSRNQDVAGLISYMGNAGETRFFVPADNSFTVKALYRLGFSWPVIGDEYIRKAVSSLRMMRFFR